MSDMKGYKYWSSGVGHVHIPYTIITIDTKLRDVVIHEDYKCSANL